MQQIPFAKKGMYSRPLFTNANEKGWKIKQACPINRSVEVVSSFSLPLRWGWRWLARRAHHAVGRVDDVQESILVLVLLVDLREEGTRLGQRVAVHEEEDGLVGPELDVLPNLRDQLCDGNIARSQEPATKFVSIFWPPKGVVPSNECGEQEAGVLPLGDVGNELAPGVLLNDHGNSVRVGGPDLRRETSPLLCF